MTQAAGWKTGPIFIGTSIFAFMRFWLKNRPKKPDLSKKCGKVSRDVVRFLKD
jgi:hypothetical protein